MFSPVQQQEPLSLCDQSLSLTESYQALQAAYVNLAQTYERWNKEADAYLREEKYMGCDAKELIGGITDLLEPLQKPMQQLAIDHQNLCNDLLRVGRGESFSV